MVPVTTITRLRHLMESQMDLDSGDLDWTLVLKFMKRAILRMLFQKHYFQLNVHRIRLILSEVSLI